MKIILRLKKNAKNIILNIHGVLKFKLIYI